MEIELLLKYLVLTTIILFSFPWILGHCLVFTTGIYLKFYKQSRLKGGQKVDFDFWKDARQKVGRFWLTFARIWHGYEIKGLENLPKSPSLLIAFHGALPVDGYFLMHSVFLKTGRQLCGVTDRFLAKFPGFKYYSQCFQMSPADLNGCIDWIKSGKTLMILPGGAFEGHMSENYKLEWRNRLGFAKVALETKVPIVPIFTTNIQEGYRTIGIFMGFWRSFYERTRYPLVPMYGGFPVKLTTYIGEPIQIEEGMTPEELKGLVMKQIENMIKKHQRRPGSILLALRDRFY